MILITHIAVALLSVLLATYMIVNPSKRGISATYALTGATLASGTYLVVSSSAHILQACITGLLFVSVVSVALAVAHTKLARARS